MLQAPQLDPERVYNGLLFLNVCRRVGDVRDDIVDGHPASRLPTAVRRDRISIDVNLFFETGLRKFAV